MPIEPSMSLPERSVSECIIRQAFNAGEFWERAKLGVFARATGAYNNHYSEEDARERSWPYCTRSQIVRYFDRDGHLIAVVHQIRRPDGSLAGSGKPDPKYLRLESEILRVKRTKD